jgi:hypothetical protein
MAKDLNYRGQNKKKMKEVKTWPIEELIQKTDSFRYSKRIDSVEPDPDDPNIPDSIFKYNPVTWQESDGIWHTLLGSAPGEGIWTFGSSSIESMQEFDKELQLSLKPDGIVEALPEKVRQQIHKKVFDKLMWGMEFSLN